LATLVKRLQQELAEPLDFRCPTMVVTTLNGYRPTLNDIAAIINESYGRPTIHELDKVASPSREETS